MISYTYEMIQKSPDEFNDLIVSTIKKKYQNQINKIFEQLRRDTNVNLINEYQSRLERQIFPALVLFEELNIDWQTGITFCYGFLKSALPVLILDKWLDEGTIINKIQIGEMLNSLWETQRIINSLENGNNLLFWLSQNYKIEIQTMLAEYQNRYIIPENISINYYLGGIDKELGQYRTIGRLFYNVIGSVLLLKNIQITSQLLEMIRLFDVLRQITDEIADVKEDLKQGIISLPIRNAILAQDIRPQIQKYWDQKLDYNIIDNYLRFTKAYQKSYVQGINLYQKCKLLKKGLRNSYPFLDALFVFYDLKLCLLYRLKRNNWKDNKKKY